MKRIEDVLSDALLKRLANKLSRVEETIECKRHDRTKITRQIAELSWESDMILGHMNELNTHTHETSNS
tara:strand:+ start:681 stop:887 length:207 start_codon:yes stop_codon:yes gene_type:complete